MFLLTSCLTVLVLYRSTVAMSSNCSGEDLGKNLGLFGRFWLLGRGKNRYFAISINRANAVKKGSDISKAIVAARIQHQ